MTASTILPSLGCVLTVLLIGCQPEGHPSPTVAGEAQINGTTVQYDIAGGGHPLVLIHGGFMDRRMWDEQLQPFGERYKVIRVNLRGFGGTPLPDEPFSYTDDLYALLKTLDTGPAYLLGLSLGAMVATEFTTIHPEMVDALILAGAPLRGLAIEDTEGTAAKMIGVIQTFRRGELDSTVALTLELPFFNPADENPAVRQRMTIMIRDNFGHWLQSLPLVRWDSVLAIDRIGSIDVPTLIIVGDHDTDQIRIASDSLAAGIRGAEKVVIRNASHHINMEAPEAFDATVLEFLERQ